MSNKITDKELLAFSNLTNLDWQFVKLEYKIINKQKVYPKLKGLLNPKLFVREYKKENGELLSRKYIYGDKNGELDITQGNIEMRKSAGLGMECIEDMNGKGKELKGWEVIYGADKYKIIADYLDNQSIYLEKIADIFKVEKVEKIEYPTREEVEKEKKTMEIFEFSMKLVEIAGYILPSTIEYFHQSKTLLKLGLKSRGIISTAKEVAGGIKKPIKYLDEYMKGISKNLKDTSKLYWSAAVFNEGSVGSYTIIDGLLEKKKDGLNNKTKEELIKEFEKASNLENTPEIHFRNNMNMYDNGFRVLVLKKGNDIVITYKSSKNTNEELLPEEMNCLQMVYWKIKQDEENTKCEISFTGLGAGAGGDLAILSSVMYSENGVSFCNQESKISNYNLTVLI